MKTARTFFSRLNYFEPARVRAIYTAAAALFLTLGITIPANVDHKAQALLAFLAVAYPVGQGEVTRRKVYSPASADHLAAPKKSSLNPDGSVK